MKTSSTAKRKRKKSLAGPDEITTKFPFLKHSEIIILSELISSLKLGDPVVVLHWNQAALAAAALANPVNTKDILLEIIAEHGGTDPTEQGNIFMFRSDPELSACRNALPAWSLSPGPRGVLLGMAAVESIAVAHVIRAAQRMRPDITLEPFFAISS